MSKSPATEEEKCNTSINEAPVDFIDKELAPLLKVVKPSRNSLSYGRME